jgi:hypothetical protein
MNIPLRLSGHVRITRADGSVIFDGHNNIVDTAYELLLRGLMGVDSVANVQFALTGGKPVAAGMKALPGVVATSPVANGTTTTTQQDDKGLRTIATWTTVYTPTGPITYDMLGLIGASGLLGAALAVAPVTLAAGEAISVHWTIQLRGV